MPGWGVKFLGRKYDQKDRKKGNCSFIFPIEKSMLIYIKLTYKIAKRTWLTNYKMVKVELIRKCSLCIMYLAIIVQLLQCYVEIFLALSSSVKNILSECYLSSIFSNISIRNFQTSIVIDANISRSIKCLFETTIHYQIWPLHWNRWGCNPPYVD